MNSINIRRRLAKLEGMRVDITRMSAEQLSSHLQGLSDKELSRVCLRLADTSSASDAAKLRAGAMDLLKPPPPLKSWEEHMRDIWSDPEQGARARRAGFIEPIRAVNA